MKKSFPENNAPRLNSILQTQREMICRFLPDTTLTFVNRAFCLATQQSEEELLGKSFLELLPDKNQPLLQEALAAINSSDPVYYCQCRIVVQERNEVWQEWTCYGIFKSEKEAAVEYQAVGRDITEQKHSEERLEHLTNHVLDLLALSDSEGVCLYASPSYQEILGFSPQEMEGTNLHDLVHPQDKEDVKNAFETCLRTLTPCRVEYRYRHANGRYLWLESVGDAVVGPNGLPKYKVIASRDITARRKMEEELRQSRELYRSVVESQTDLIARVDQENRLTYVNDAYCRCFGKSKEELLGQTFTPLVHPDDIEHTLKALEELKKPPHRIEFEQRAMTNRGWRWIYWNDIAILDDAGEVVEIQGVGRDITDIKEAQSEVQKANQMLIGQRRQLRRLSAKVAEAHTEEQRRLGEGLHDDLAQILAAINFKLTAAMDCQDSNRLRQLQEGCMAMLNTAIQKVRNLSFELKSSVLETKGLWEGLHELCHTMNQRYDMNFELKGGPIKDVLDEKTSTVLYKAARELMFNVVKHSGVDQATIVLEQKGQFVNLMVIDNGSGFKGATCEGLTFRGQGLGLFEINERMHELGGYMTIKSTPGQEARISLWVPLRPANRMGGLNIRLGEANAHP